MQNKPNSSTKHTSIDLSKQRFKEVASMLLVSIKRLQLREKEKFLQKPLDFSKEESVTAALTEHKEN